MGRATKAPLAVLVVALVALAGSLAAGCGDSSSTASTTAVPSAATQLTWLTDHVRQWNAALNSDQNAVDTAAASGGRAGSSSSAFLSQLSAACTKMLADVSNAKSVPPAPAASLQRAWERMLSATEDYASKCLKVVQSHSDTDLTAWQNSLKSMNSASAAWNSAVNAVRIAAGSASG